MTIRHIDYIANCSPRCPITLQIGEIEDFDYSESAEQILCILNVMELSKIIDKNPYISVNEVEATIHNLIDDIDLGLDTLQISEYKYIRVEFRDELLSIETYLGV